MATNLAPFIDVKNDGRYNPKNGDCNGSGGTMKTPWVYPLDTIMPGQSIWTEKTANNLPGDRRYVHSANIGKWLPGELQQLDYAIVFRELRKKIS